MWRGDKLDRLTSVVLIVASIVSVAADNLVSGTFARPEIGVAVVDIVLLAYLLFVMKASTKFWPIWAVGFHTISVATHITVLIAPQFLSTPYAIYSEWWALSVVLALLAGSFESGSANKRAISRS